MGGVLDAAPTLQSELGCVGFLVLVIWAEFLFLAMAGWKSPATQDSALATGRIVAQEAAESALLPSPSCLSETSGET